MTGLPASSRRAATGGLRISERVRLIGLTTEALVAVLPGDAMAATELFARPAEGGRLPDWAGAAPVDQQLSAWLRRHPAIGARERRWLSDRVYDVLRHGRAFEAFVCGPGQEFAALGADDAGGARDMRERLQAMVCLSAALSARTGRDAAASTDPEAGMPDTGGAGHGAGQAVVDRYHQWLAEQPEAVRYSLPDWFWAELQASHGAAGAAKLAGTLLLPAAIEIRCNLLRGKAAVLQKRLAEAGIAAEQVATLPAALRISGRPALTRLPLFEQGWFELQDAGSQAIAEHAAARRGERVIDFCAGAGGKTLALAARMRNQGQILAFDTEDARLARLGPRLRRAGVDVVTPMRLSGCDDRRLGRYAGWSDLVLLDAPCSGSGTLRRHPDLKWRLQPGDVQKSQQLQQQILMSAVHLLRPGGRLVYATCSLLAQENEAQMRWLAGQFGRSGSGEEADRGRTGNAPERAITLVAGPVRHWLPEPAGGDAFFMASWQRGQA
ncbi:MAG: RsmB/NOP family class I SAM-dependent RNA methyltransferase [Lautropia sp.]|nr:RsmB/NOP family class I SAM-dependent RNA methyltransferase [Lautropia sp.]